MSDGLGERKCVYGSSASEPYFQRKNEERKENQELVDLDLRSTFEFVTTHGRAPTPQEGGQLFTSQGGVGFWGSRVRVTL